MCNVGICYSNCGEGVTHDYKKAIELFQCAANKVNTKALFGLGLCYMKGLGGSKEGAKERQRRIRHMHNGNACFCCIIFLKSKV